VPSRALPEIERHLKAGDWNGFRKQLRRFEVATAFPYSGYVVVVVVEFLREQGIELPVSREPVVQLLIERCDPLTCANRSDAMAAATAIAGVSVSDVALAAYWRDLTGDEEFEDGRRLLPGKRPTGASSWMGSARTTRY